jgi:hypothetical protein
MIRYPTLSSTLLTLALVFTWGSALAEQGQCTGPSAEAFLACAASCEKSFYFSEHSDASFASLRSACIEGCGYVEDQRMSAYERCSGGCRETFPFRHGMNTGFAEIQKTCITACRRVR